jgi:hypothetical protein
MWSFCMMAALVMRMTDGHAATEGSHALENSKEGGGAELPAGPLCPFFISLLIQWGGVTPVFQKNASFSRTGGRHRAVIVKNLWDWRNTCLSVRGFFLLNIMRHFSHLRHSALLRHIRRCGGDDFPDFRLVHFAMDGIRKAVFLVFALDLFTMNSPPPSRFPFRRVRLAANGPPSAAGAEPEPGVRITTGCSRPAGRHSDSRSIPQEAAA